MTGNCQLYYEDIIIIKRQGQNDTNKKRRILHKLMKHNDFDMLF